MKTHGQPVKVSANITFHKNRNPTIEWNELGTNKRKKVTVKPHEDPVEKLKEVRTSLESELLEGDYDTCEKRVRNYLKLRDDLQCEHNNGCEIKNEYSKTGILYTARFQSGIGQENARMGEKVIRVIDELIEDGKDKEARELRIALNRSYEKGYKALDDKHKVLSKKLIDSVLSNAIGNMARRIDERFEKSGGESYRDECMAILKKLSAKYDEWRASE